MHNFLAMICFFSMLAGMGQPAAAASPATVGQADGHAPAIRVPEPDYRFQDVLEGKTVTHDFLLRNEGQADLAIVKLRTD